MADDSERFWSKVDATGDCWEWTASLNETGYGRFYFRGRIWKAPRTAWTLLIGEIPSGLEIDHRCFNPPCVNPDHLRLVSRSENARGVRYNGGGIAALSQTRCLRGHEFDESNTYYVPGSPRKRQCRECKRIRGRVYDAKRRGAR